MLYAIAFAGGVLTIVSPCILPVLPFVLARADQPFRRSGLPLLIGMGLTFAVVGMLASVAGDWVVRANQFGRALAMVLFAVFGAALLFPAIADSLSRPFVRLGGLLQPRRERTRVHRWIARAGCLDRLAVDAVRRSDSRPDSDGRRGRRRRYPERGTPAHVCGRRRVCARSRAAGRPGCVPDDEAQPGHRGLGAPRPRRRGHRRRRRDRAGMGYRNPRPRVALPVEPRHRPGTAAGGPCASTRRCAALEAPAMTMQPSVAMQPSGAMMQPAMTARGTAGAASAQERCRHWMAPSSGSTVRRRRVRACAVRSCSSTSGPTPVSTAFGRFPTSRRGPSGTRATASSSSASTRRSLRSSATPGNVARAVRNLGVTYPVAVDSRRTIWTAFKNQYWPAHYFIDAQGRIRSHHFGEGSYDESERVIQALLAERNAGTETGDLVRVTATGVQAAPDLAAVRTPETYVGYSRQENYASPQSIAKDRRQRYTAPVRPDVNQWGLDGSWSVGEEHAELTTAPGKIVFRFHARDLHLVLGPRPDGRPVRFRVSLDGAPPLRGWRRRRRQGRQRCGQRLPALSVDSSERRGRGPDVPNRVPRPGRAGICVHLWLKATVEARGRR